MAPGRVSEAKPDAAKQHHTVARARRPGELELTGGTLGDLRNSPRLLPYPFNQKLRQCSRGTRARPEARAASKGCRARASPKAPPVAKARAPTFQPAVSSERSGLRRPLGSARQRDRSPHETTRRENIFQPSKFPACTTYRASAAPARRKSRHHARGSTTGGRCEQRSHLGRRRDADHSGASCKRLLCMRVK